MKIFLVEDDMKLRKLIKMQLEKFQYEVKAAEKFDNITELFKKEGPDLVLMDINLPYFDGFYWTTQIRIISKCPIIFISARDGQMDQVMALEYGGDDYIIKPFSSELLIAKVKSQLRRAYGEYSSIKEERILSQRNLIFYPERFEMEVHQNTERLSQKEAQLLEILLERFPEVVSRQELLEQIWDVESFVDDNTLSVNITRLRKKLMHLGLENSIITIRGKGYRLVLSID